MTLPILGLLWFGRTEAVPADIFSTASGSDVIREFVKEPLEKLFVGVVEKTVVNERCESEAWLCIYIVGERNSDDARAHRFLARVHAAGALAVGSHTIFISERYLGHLIQQASIDLSQYNQFLRHLDFSKQTNIDAAAKSTGISSIDIVKMQSGEQPVAEKLRDYEQNPWNNYEAGREADRSALLQLLMEEAAASGVVPTDEDVADAITTLRQAGYPDNVALLLSWTLYHEFRHLGQANDPLSRLWAGFKYARRSYEEDADQFASDKVDLLINRLIEETDRNSERSAALQSAQRASRSFWAMAILTGAVEEEIGIPLSRLTFLVDSECSDSDAPLPSHVLSARSRFFTAAQSAHVFRSKSLLLSNDEFDLLHYRIRAADGVASHDFEYYRGIHPIIAPTFDARGSKLWSDENVEWSIQKGLYNGSRGFLPDRGITDVATPLKTDVMVRFLRKVAPELVEQDVANFCGRACKLFSAKTNRINVRVELFPDKDGYVEALNLVAVEVDPSVEEPRAEKLVFDLATQLMANGRIVIEDGPETTAEYIRRNVLPEGFSAMRDAQSTCGVKSTTYSDGPTLVRIQRSDEIYYQLQFLGAGGWKEDPM